jgi:hypothetical protein
LRLRRYRPDFKVPESQRVKSTHRDSIFVIARREPDGVCKVHSERAGGQARVVNAKQRAQNLARRREIAAPFEQRECQVMRRFWVEAKEEGT